MTTAALRQFDWKRATLMLAVLLVTTIFGLWSWNTLSELFGGPTAQYKHIVAALVLLAIVRWPSHRARRKAQ